MPFAKSVERSTRESFPSRVVIEAVRPVVDNGKFPAKCVLGEQVEIEAVIFCDGHDHLKGNALVRELGETEWRRIPLKLIGNDIWKSTFMAENLTDYEFTVEACIDRLGTWAHDIEIKLGAQQASDVDVEIGRQILLGWQRRLPDNSISQFAEGLLEVEKQLSVDAFKKWWQQEELQDLSLKIQDQDSYTQFPEIRRIQVDPALAGFSSWYEFFPRSFAQVEGQHGTFAEAQKHLDYISRLGFHIVYLPPIHPIGRSYRKGKNNSLDAVSDDTGSPWAIGGSEGGHKSIHPALGTFDDFRRFVEKAAELRLKVALDIAFQCSPDHPYVKEHPEWFRIRPDGSIQYAENPPKKYQDIYPLNFETPAWESLWEELLSVFLFWIEKGVRVFRVDNPHTKSLRFWGWLLKELRRRHPDVVLLSEAFTRPHIMGHLAKLGYHQSYTYFTWRETRRDLQQYMKELTATDWRYFFRPCFWPNTPDILTQQFHGAHRPLFIQRLILAGTLSSNYGIYGPAYELLENRPVRPGSEEYLDSEKYQLRRWDVQRSDSLASVIRRLNQIRNSHPALQQNQQIWMHETTNEQIIAYTKRAFRGQSQDLILTVVNLDPRHTQSGMIHLPLDQFGLSPEEEFEVHDLLSDSVYTWRGWANFVELNPNSMPAHIFEIKALKKAEEIRS